MNMPMKVIKRNNMPRRLVVFLPWNIVFRTPDYITETKKILKHIGEETQRAPPLSPTTISANEPDGWYGDYIPSDDVYFHDEEYVY